jgi:hypothetical protein
VNVHVRALTSLAVFLLPAACDTRAGEADRAVAVASVPTTAACADAPALRQRAADDRLRVTELPSQQDQTVLAARANFLASLAVVSQLQCSVTLADENQGLQAALEAAGRAEDASSFYEQASRWGEANFALTKVIDALVQRLPSPAPE